MKINFKLKCTCFDKYLHSNSHHHPKQKVSVIKTLNTRASRISDPEHLEEELNHLYKVFINNGYQKNVIQKSIKESTTNNRKRKTLENPRISLPYIKGTTDKIAKILTKHNIMVAFTPPNTIKNMLSSAKDLIDPKNLKGVYSVPCSCGKIYIGETGRSFGIRLREHINDISKNRSEKSGLAEHACSSSHYICIEQARLIHKEDHYLKRRVKEAIEIEKTSNNMNRDDGLKLSNTWKPLINKTKKTLINHFTQ